MLTVFVPMVVEVVRPVSKMDEAPLERLRGESGEDGDDEGLRCPLYM